MARSLFTPSTRPREYALDVSRGLIPGVVGVHQQGENLDIDSGITEDIWDGGGIWVEPTTARTHQIVSTSIADDGSPAGTGARTIQIYGLDSSYALQNETLTLNGTTNVATASTYTMIHDMVIRSAGSGGGNAGTITATADTDATVTCQINVGNNHSLSAIYMVPVLKTAYMTDLVGHIEKSGGGSAVADITLFRKPLGEVWQAEETAAVSVGGSSGFEEMFNPYVLYTAKTIIKVQTTSGNNNNVISAGFDLYLVDD